MIELTSSAAIFSDFPWPPTSNSIYTGQSRRKAADILKVYRSSTHEWWLVNREMVFKVREHLHNKTHNSGFVLSVHRFFYYQTEDLYTSAGNIKKNDVTNRIKCLDDCLFEILQLDDRLIWEGSEKKCVTKQRPYVRVIITPTLAEGCFNEFPKIKNR